MTTQHQTECPFCHERQDAVYPVPIERMPDGTQVTGYKCLNCSRCWLLYRRLDGRVMIAMRPSGQCW